MPDSAFAFAPLLANGAGGNDPWTWLTLVASLAAIVTSVAGLTRMLLSQGKFTGTIEQKVSTVERDQNAMKQDVLRDRTDSWQAIKELREENRDCNRERGELREAIATWKASLNAKIEQRDSPGKRSHPRDVT